MFRIPREFFRNVLPILIFFMGATNMVSAQKYQLWGVDSNITEAQVPAYTLPTVPQVSETGAWEAERQKIVALFAREMYGELPDILQRAGNHPPFVTFRVLETGSEICEGRGIRKQIAVEFRDPVTLCVRQTALLLLYIPKTASASRPVPCFVALNFKGNHTIFHDPEILVREGEPAGNRESLGMQSRRWPVARILDAGFALATMHYFDIVPDRDIKPDSYGELTEGLFGVYSPYTAERPRPAQAWGFIAAWAYGLSRIQDYIETDPVLDSAKVALLGHSRLGKTALWAGASDPRFALVISNDSGCGGAALNYREFGERVLLMNTVRPYWFCLNWKKYGNDVTQMPFDSHLLIAAIAPRPVYVASASDDSGADPRGEFLALVHAQPAWSVFGCTGLGIPVSDGTSAFDDTLPTPSVNTPVVGDALGYHLRAGKHDLQEYDWIQYLDFARKHFR